MSSDDNKASSEGTKNCVSEMKITDFNHSEAPLEVRVAEFLSSLGAPIIGNRLSISSDATLNAKDHHGTSSNNWRRTSRGTPSENENFQKSKKIESRKRMISEVNQPIEVPSISHRVLPKIEISGVKNSKVFEVPLSPSQPSPLTAPSVADLVWTQKQQHCSNNATEYGIFNGISATTMKVPGVVTNPCIIPPSLIPISGGTEQYYQAHVQAKGIRELEKDWETHMASMEQVLMANRSQGLPNGPISEEALQLLSQMISNLYGLNTKVMNFRLQNIIDIHRRNTERITRVFHGLAGVKKPKPNPQ